jgi:putative transposase
VNRLLPGAPVVWQDKNWILLDIHNLEQAVVRDSMTGTIQIVPTTELRLNHSLSSSQSRGLMTIENHEWDEAVRRFEALKSLVGQKKRERTCEDIDAVATRFGKDRVTIYRWIRRWEKTQTVSGLVRAKRSDRGASRLDPQVEDIIKQQISDFYLVKERPSVVELWERIAIACREANLKTPNINTIRRRVDRVPDRLVLSKRYSTKQAKEKFEPLKGSFPGADYPLAVYQIDHTPVDICLVDEQYRREIGRPYLTIVTDVCTRMLAGFYVSFDPPGALATGLALSHAILPKEVWLAARELDTNWPIYGIPKKIHADNAAEFRGQMIGRACREYGIIMENRPKGQPNFGGHVERLFRTFMGRVQSLPGSTFSNVQARGEYNSEGKAVLTLLELEQWFTIFVTSVYHQRPHKGIQRAVPIKLYEQFIIGTDEHIGIGLPAPIADEFKLRLDFMPFVERTVQEYGVVIDNIHYYADVLRPWVHARDPKKGKLKRKFIFARDPRDISEVYFLDPETSTYYPIPYRNITRPRISAWELSAVMKWLGERPEMQVDEDAIFSGLAEMARIEQEALQKSRKVRRTVQRRKNWQETATSQTKPDQSQPAITQSKTERLVWVGNVQPFDDIEEAE